MSVRLILWLLVFLGFWINDMFKNSVNIAITSMVKDNDWNGRNNAIGCVHNANFTILYKSMERSSRSSIKITFDWNEYEQELILNSFFWIHWVTQLPGGILTHYYGTKKVLGLTIFLGAILNILIPFAAKLGVKTLVAVRLFQGLAGGFAWPSVPLLTAKWIPPKDRALFLSAYLGGSAGWAITYVLSSFIIDKYGWQYMFFIQSIFGVIWCITWKHLAYDNPSEHPRISMKEKTHILDRIRKAGFVYDQNLVIPWNDILTSKAVWANLIACTGTVWGLFTLITVSPSYLKYLQGLDSKSSAIFFGICHIIRWLFALTFSVIAKHQKQIPLQKVRKIATSLCTIGAGSTMLIVGLSHCNIIPALATFFLAIVLLSIQGAGPVAIFLDMSPNFAGVMTGIGGTAGALSGLISPILLDYLMRNNAQQVSFQWRKFFMIIGSICCISGFADLPADTSLQPWNTLEAEESSKQNHSRVLTGINPSKSMCIEIIAL